MWVSIVCVIENIKQHKLVCLPVCQNLILLNVATDFHIFEYSDKCHEFKHTDVRKNQRSGLKYANSIFRIRPALKKKKFQAGRSRARDFVNDHYDSRQTLPALANYRYSDEVLEREAEENPKNNLVW